MILRKIINIICNSKLTIMPCCGSQKYKLKNQLIISKKNRLIFHLSAIDILHEACNGYENI